MIDPYLFPFIGLVIYLVGIATALGLVESRLALVRQLENELSEVLKGADRIGERRYEDKEFWRRLDSARELLGNIEAHEKAKKGPH